MTRPLRQLGSRRRLLVVAAVVVAAGALSGTLIAYFSGAASAGSAGGAAATSVNAGTSPTSAANAGRSVTLTWSAATLASGQPVDGYLVTRYEATPPYAPQLTQAGCSGTITALTCTEYGVPFGSWQYTITPLKGDNWRGLESTKSGTVTIGAASLTLDQSTLGLASFGSGLDDATLTGSLTGFASNEGITFKLDDPSGGSTLSGTPSSADGSGDASVSITLPRPSDGPHSIYAVGDGAYPSQASASILVDTTPPTSSASGSDANWHAADVTVNLTATDGASGAGVKNIKYQVDAGSVQTITGSGGGDATINAPSNHSNDGSHTISFFATDNADNVESPSNSVTVRIDTTKPTTSLATNPASPDGDNGWFKRASVDFTLSASDASSGVAASSYTIDGGQTQTYSGSAVTVSGQGDHTVTYWSVDNAGNVEAVNTTHIKLDNVKPSTSLSTSPASPDGDNNWFKQPSVDFTLTGSDATSGIAHPYYTVDGGGAQTYAGAVTLGQGDHTVTYWSVDNAGNVEDVHTTHVKVDNVKPATTLATVPASPDGDNSWFKQASVQFTLSGSDASSGVASTKYRIDGGAVQTYGDAVTINTQGDHTVTFWSVDNAGNVEDVNTTHIKLDNVKPSTLLATTPASPDGTNNWFTHPTVSFTLSGTDATSGVAHSHYTVDGGGQTTYTGAVALGQGDHTVTFWSVDNAGNVEDVGTTHVKVDDVKPSTSIVLTPSSPDGTNGWRVSATSFTLSASDATSGVATTKYQIDSGAVTTYPGSAVSIPNGQHTVTYWSVDNAGNTETSQTTATIKVDTVNPSTSITLSPATPNGTNAWYKTTPTFTLGASDATSGVGSSKYKIDSGTTQTYSSAVSIPDGQHTISYWSVDNAGNTESTNTTATIKVDTTAPPAPTLTFGNFTNASSTGSTVFYRPGASSGAFRVTASSTDADSGIFSYQFPAFPSGWTSTPGSLGVNTYSWSSANPTVPASTQNVTATNSAGLASANGQFTVTADSTAPSTTDNTGSIGNGWKTTAQTVTLTPTDGGSGVASTYYASDGSTPTTSSSQGTSVNLSSDGTYTVKYFSTDKVGNQESVKTAGTQIRIDGTEPTGSITAPSGTVSGSSVAISSNSADATSGVASAQFQVATHGGSFSNLGSADTSSPYGVTWNTTSGFPNGDYDLRVVTTDNAGNTFTSPAITVTVNNAPLTILTVVRDGGSKKVHFTGNGAVASTTITVTICAVNSFPCASPVGTSVATSPSAGNWTSAQDSANLNNGVNYFAQAVQGSSTSAVFSFTVTSL